MALRSNLNSIVVGAKDPLSTLLKDNRGNSSSLSDNLNLVLGKPMNIAQGLESLLNHKVASMLPSTGFQSPVPVAQSGSKDDLPLSYSQPSSNISYKDYLPVSPAQEAEEEMREIKEQLKQPFISSAQRNSLVRQMKDLRQFVQREQDRIDSHTKSYFDETAAHYEVADMADKRLNRMENLIKKGGLPIAAFYQTFKRLGEVPPAYAAATGAAAGGLTAGPIGSAVGGILGGLISPVATMLSYAQRKTSPNTEEFEKLSTDFIRDAKNIFGNRITDQDLQAFLASIPTLSQTDSGKLAIINNMRIMNKAARVKYNVMKDIIKANKGKRPENLQFIVEELAKPQLDEITKEFETVT